jgi:hypothetical protein
MRVHYEDFGAEAIHENVIKKRVQHFLSGVQVEDMGGQRWCAFRSSQGVLVLVILTKISSTCNSHVHSSDSFTSKMAYMAPIFFYSYNL